MGSATWAAVSVTWVSPAMTAVKPLPAQVIASETVSVSTASAFATWDGTAMIALQVFNAQEIAVIRVPASMASVCVLPAIATETAPAWCHVPVIATIGANALPKNASAILAMAV